LKENYVGGLIMFAVHISLKTSPVQSTFYKGATELDLK
jgi:hypothetical protein